jgi:multidrug efflux system membrane fusion protein
MQMPPTRVNVAPVVEREVAAWDEFSGRFVAVDAAEIRPRVMGYLTRIAYVEGSEVARGDLLFEIDDREYRAALARAEAEVARARTRLTKAERDVERGRKLVEIKAMSREEWDQKEAELAQAKADLAAMQAAAEQARLQLEFTRVTAPIAGRVGEARIKVGNLVDASTVLTDIVALDPIHVHFEGDERTWLRYRERNRAGTGPGTRPQVQVGLADEDGYPHTGEVDFVDTRLDPATGTIRARAVLANPDRRFAPGLYARVRLLGARPQPKLLIHEQAVLTDQDKKYVYVVGAGNAAQRKDVVLGAKVDGLRIVEEGLTPGDRVVVNGMRRIFFPGALLDPVTVPMTAPNTIVEAPAAAAPRG